MFKNAISVSTRMRRPAQFHRWVSFDPRIIRGRQGCPNIPGSPCSRSGWTVASEELGVDPSPSPCHPQGRQAFNQQQGASLGPTGVTDVLTNSRQATAAPIFPRWVHGVEWPAGEGPTKRTSDNRVCLPGSCRSPLALFFHVVPPSSPPCLPASFSSADFFVLSTPPPPPPPPPPSPTTFDAHQLLDCGFYSAWSPSAARLPSVCS